MKRLMRNKKVVEIVGLFVGLLAMSVGLIFMVMFSEYRKEKCIENGGRVVDNVGVYDSCIYGG